MNARPLLLALSLAACAAGPPAAGSSSSSSGSSSSMVSSSVMTGVDGSYACTGDHSAGGSCTEPLVSNASNWTLTIAGDDVTAESLGFDTPRISCTGAWTGDDFTCTPSWSRAGRACSIDFHIHHENDGSLRFWVGNIVDDWSACHR